MEPLELRLLNEFQRDFPLERAPFDRVAERIGCSEGEVLATLRALQARGAVSRVGAVVAPRRIGASTLAALAVAPQALDTVAAQVSALAQVNHNYEREHAFNLWFVVTACDAAALDGVLERVRRESGCPLITLPLREEFHIDLGFDLCGGHRWSERSANPAPAGPVVLGDDEWRLMAALEDGLDLVPQPFARLAMRCGLAEEAVRARIADWLARGVVKRFGVVVRHHELGYAANAMAVWDVPDAEVSAAGRRLAATGDVSLCYRRERDLPHWPYNLFCMIHGRDRRAVEAQVADLADRVGLAGLPHALLFSRRRFKQSGARYLSAGGAGHG
jgi:DNA-binding Lrp family transcriptional regulator